MVFLSCRLNLEFDLDFDFSLIDSRSFEDFIDDLLYNCFIDCSLELGCVLLIPVVILWMKSLYKPIKSW